MSDQQQSRLIYDVLDALGEVVRAVGGPKEVGHRLRPELPLDQAAQWVRDCLNRNRREKFDPEQVLLLLKWGRAKDCHVAIQFMAEDAGYSRPLPIDPRDEARDLQERAERLLVELKLITERQERLVRVPLAAVK